MLQDGTNLGSLDKYAVPIPTLHLTNYIERTKERRKDKITGQLTGYISYKPIESDGTQIPHYVSVTKSESGNNFLSDDLDPHHPQCLGKTFHHHQEYPAPYILFYTLKHSSTIKDDHDKVVSVEEAGKLRRTVLKNKNAASKTKLGATKTKKVKEKTMASMQFLSKEQLDLVKYAIEGKG
jgi:hypothetical protein